MDQLQFNCTKSGIKLTLWIILGLTALGLLKGAASSYLRSKGGFELAVGLAAAAGLIWVSYTVRSYFRYKSVTLHVTAQGNDFCMANKDEHGQTIQETHIELNKIHRAWILKTRGGYEIVVVLTTSKNDEQNIPTVPSDLYDIRKSEATAILAFIHHHNPSANIGYM